MNTNHRKEKPDNAGLAERLRSDAQTTRPSFDDALHARICRAVSEQRPSAGGDSRDRVVPRSRSRRMAWVAVTAAALFVALLIIASQGPSARDEGAPSSEIAVAPTNDAPSPSPEDISDEEAIAALCEVIGETADTPNEMHRRVESLEIRERGMLMVGSARTTAGTLIDQVPWAFLEDSGRKSRHAKEEDL